MEVGTQAPDFFLFRPFPGLVNTVRKGEQDIFENRQRLFHHRTLMDVNDPGSQVLVPEFPVGSFIEGETAVGGQEETAEKPKKTGLPASGPSPDQGNLPALQREVDPLEQGAFGV